MMAIATVVVVTELAAGARAWRGRARNGLCGPNFLEFQEFAEILQKYKCDTVRIPISSHDAVTCIKCSQH